MWNMEAEVRWAKCAEEKVPVIVQAAWNGFVHGVFHIPRQDMQAICDLHRAYRRCRHATGSNLFIDCDADALLCKVGVFQSDVWLHAWPDEQLPHPEAKTISLWNGRLLREPMQWEGLLPVVTQDAKTRKVLMLAWASQDALAEALATYRACYFSRSRNRLWRKGEESGHVQELFEVQAMYLEEKPAVLLYFVHQIGGVPCHDGYRTCFYREIMDDGLKVVEDRLFDPKQVYKK